MAELTQWAQDNWMHTKDSEPEIILSFDKERFAVCDKERTKTMIDLIVVDKKETNCYSTLVVIPPLRLFLPPLSRKIVSNNPANRHNHRSN